MTSSRASEVAELLWELKRAQKIAKYSTLAKQAGFSAGLNGRTMATTIRTIRRDWPYLEWWRAIGDDGLLEKHSEQEEKLRQSGYELEEAKGKRGALTIKSLEYHLMNWSEEQVAKSRPPSDSLIRVVYDENDFSPDEMVLFLRYLSEAYRDLDGDGLRVVDGGVFSYEAEVIA